MNRAQRRKAAKKNPQQMCPKQNNVIKINRVSPKDAERISSLDFSTVPLATMCQTIQLLIDELSDRGYPIYDFDNKNKAIKQIQILRGKVFFLAEERENE